MGYAIVSEHDSFGAAGSTTFDSPNFTPAAGNVLLLITKYNEGTSARTPTFSNTATAGKNDGFTQCGSGAYEGAVVGTGIRAFIVNSATADSSTIRLTWPVSVSNCGIYIVQISGLTATPYLDSKYRTQENPGNAADAIDTQNMGVLASQPALLIGLACRTSQGANISVGTGFTATAGGTCWFRSTADTATPEYKYVTSTAADNGTWTTDQASDAGTIYLSSIVALAEAASGGLPFFMQQDMLNGGLQNLGRI